MKDLRLKASARFITKKGWQPRIIFGYTFINEGKERLLVNAYMISRAMGIERIVPQRQVGIKRISPEMWVASKMPAPARKHIITLLPGGMRTVKREIWANKVMGVFRSKEGGFCSYRLKKTGKYAITFFYEPFGNRAFEDLGILRKGEKLWEGKISSASVPLDVTEFAEDENSLN